jgi:hypothetical protein
MSERPWGESASVLALTVYWGILSLFYLSSVFHTVIIDFLSKTSLEMVFDLLGATGGACVMRILYKN